MSVTYSFTSGPNPADAVTYSFTTGAAYTGVWPCLDLYGSTMGGIFLMPEADVSRGSPWIALDGNDDLKMRSDDGIASMVEVELPLTATFTFETNLKIPAMPVNMQALDDSRIFIALFDAQDNAGGILIAKTGLAIVSAFGNQVAPIAGSQNILFEGDTYYTIRMVVDGPSNVMDLYITKTHELSYTGHVLRYTAGAPITPSGTADHMRIEVIGQPLNPIEVRFDSLRCNCEELLVPNKRPIADTGQDQAVALGTAVGLDGTASYDPEREPISYTWSVIQVPEGSAYRITGTAGFTADDGDGDGYTTLFQDSSNPWSADNAPDLQPGDILVVGGYQYIVDSTDWTYDSALSLWTRGGTFDPSQLRVITDNIPDSLSSQSWDLYYQSNFFDDRTAPQPAFIPDKVGPYQLQLVVNDGQLDSLADITLVNVTDSNAPLGCIPDLNFIWDYLSDAWGLWDDTGPITTLWSGFAQVATNVLLSAWQYDYGKSLKDIPRYLQRRWLNYSPLIEETTTDRAEAELYLVRGPIVSADLSAGVTLSSAILLMSKDGADAVTVALDGTYTTQQLVTAITAALGENTQVNKTARVATEGAAEYLVLERDSLLVVHKEGTANSALGFSTTADTYNDLAGSDGAADPLSAGQMTAFKASDPLVQFSAQDIERQDLLVFDGVGYEVLKVAQTDQLSTLQELASGTGKRWLISSFVRVPTTDFTAGLVEAGDIAIFELHQSGSSDAQNILCEVTGARNQAIGFNPAPLYQATAGNLDGWTVTYLGVRRVSKIAVDDLVERIPRLQDTILDPDEEDLLHQNIDYTIQDDDNGVRGIYFATGTFGFDNPPPDNLWAEVTYLDNSQMIEDNFGAAVDFNVEDMQNRSDDLDYLATVQGLWYAFYHGPSKYRALVGTQILLGLPFAEVDGTIEDINTTYSPTQVRLLVRDTADTTILRSYFLPRNTAWEADSESMVAINPDTGVEYAVGDTVAQFAPLSKGVEVKDWVAEPGWWSGYYGQGVFLEVEKYFQFMVQADVDVFSLSNLIFAIEFVKSIKPTYTFPFWSVLKRLAPDEIDVTDAVALSGTLHLFDDPTSQGADGTGGSYRFDDTDESGNANWAYDGVPLSPSGNPEFLYDKRRLYPEEHITAIMLTTFAGGVLPFDWIWAFDDGGGTDSIPLEDSSNPVGVVTFDTSYPADTYRRGKTI